MERAAYSESADLKAIYLSTHLLAAVRLMVPIWKGGQDAR